MKLTENLLPHKVCTIRIYEIIDHWKLYMINKNKSQLKILVDIECSHIK